MTTVERWGVLELPLDAPAAVEFRHESGDAAYVESFPDGDRHLLRFMPDLEGEWGYSVPGSPAARFTCTPATTRGPVRRHGPTLRWADGTPYHPLTTTWFGEPAHWPEALRALAAAPFDRVRLRAHPDDVGGLDARVRDLMEVNAGADIVISSGDELFIRNLVNRLGAYRNITWCLEVAADVRSLAELIAEYDSGQHLISAHAAADPGVPWLTHLSVSLENLRGVSALRRDFGKPVHVTCGYEGNGSIPETSLTGPEMLTRIWEGTVRGAYVTHGEWYVDEPWSAGGVRPTGVVAQRLRLLREVLDELPDGVEPIDDYRDAPTLAVPGSYYLQYLGEHRFPDRTFTLPSGSYQVEILDVWNHSVRRFHETVSDHGPDHGTDTLTVRLPGTQYQAIQIRRVA